MFTQGLKLESKACCKENSHRKDHGSPHDPSSLLGRVAVRMDLIGCVAGYSRLLIKVIILRASHPPELDLPQSHGLP